MFMNSINQSNCLIVIVTFNRCSDLKVCVEALRGQSYSSISILVVNNGSTDGTRAWLDEQKDLIVIHQENLGGAGGFYTGMKYMYENNYEFLVMMDDDGIPDANEIAELISAYPTITKKECKDAIVNALVIDKDDHEHVSFLWARGVDRSNKVVDLIKESYFEGIHPFNGTLVPRTVIEKIGFIKKEMFIWGDEKEYMARAVHNGIGLYTVTKAIHYHPKEKGKKGNIIPFVSKYQILVKPKSRSHFYYRNEGFIYNTYPEKRSKKKLFWCAQVMYNLFHFQIGEMIKFIRYFHKGSINDYRN